MLDEMTRLYQPRDKIGTNVDKRKLRNVAKH